MTYETLNFALENSIALITFNRPMQMNAINVTLAQELEHAAKRCRDDLAVRCVVLTGAGDRAFCTGGDVVDFASDPTRVGSLIETMTGHLHEAISVFARMRAPVIAKVNGTVAGAGLGLMAAADFAVASNKAKFTGAYTKIGLTPDGSTTWFLPRLIGGRKTKELFLLNPVLSADQAAEWGLVNRVVAPEELAATVDGIAQQFALGPTEAYGSVKQLIMASDDSELESQMKLERATIVKASRTQDGLAGVQAFKDKAEPRFVGK
ncbi:enoyl-CoA hydratase/isomerase family protein [Trinickia mobilis]|uniref:enoyl-CoA hydratase/isomerase family protein n=1 Tax=Trinickia mobilis TaxID=2816356 RepID=UPI001A8CD887|nr:enoyl-CoA hydratase-related protein [Trinickia mobilis]